MKTKPTATRRQILKTMGIVGAWAFQIGSALSADPKIPARINKHLSRWLNTHRVDSPKDLVGQVILPD